MKDAKPGIPFIPEKPKDENANTSDLPTDFLVGDAPGQPPERFEPGQAKKVKAGSDIILQVHYTTDGKASRDRSRVGLVFAKEPPPNRAMTFSATNGRFKIPAGDPNYRVDAEFTIGADVILHSLHPHMHARGKDFLYRVQYSIRTGGSKRCSASRSTVLRGSSGTPWKSPWRSRRERRFYARLTSIIPRTTGSIPIRRERSDGAIKVGTR